MINDAYPMNDLSFLAQCPLLNGNTIFYFYFSMLDDFGTELETTDSKLDSTMKRVAKVLHLSNGKN